MTGPPGFITMGPPATIITHRFRAVTAGSRL
jgi:hypothetical protein